MKNHPQHLPRPGDSADLPPSPTDPSAAPSALPPRRPIGPVGPWYKFNGISNVLLGRAFRWLALAAVLLGILLPPTGFGPPTCVTLRAWSTPCPGCGLTRSVTCAFHGKFHESWRYHPMGVFFGAVFVLLALANALPKRFLTRLTRRLSRYDAVVGWGIVVFCVILFAYGTVRIFLVHMGHPEHVWWRDSMGQHPPFMESPDDP